MRDDWVTVVPAAGEVKEVARALLALAASPNDVRTAGTGTEFRIPPYLADLYNAPPKRRRPKKEEVTSNGNDLRESGTREADASDASG